MKYEFVPNKCNELKDLVLNYFGILTKIKPNDYFLKFLVARLFKSCRLNRNRIVGEVMVYVQKYIPRMLPIKYFPIGFI